MTLPGIITLLLLLVSLIVFIYIIVVTARSWGVLHTLLLCTLFIESWVFIVFAAGVQYKRVNTTKLAAENRIKAETALAQTERLLWNNFDVENVNFEAVVPTKAELRRLTADRGRVWRTVSFNQAAGGGYQLELSQATAPTEIDPLAEADPAAAAAAGSVLSSESLPVDLVVYAFGEEMNPENQPLPVFYLGEFTVAQSQGGLITLQPTRPLRKEQLDSIANGSASTWTLYELLPLDSHVAFAAPGSSATDDSIFGRMDEETLSGLFANVPEENERRQKLLKSYLGDGQQPADDVRSEDVWVKVNILKDYELDVDSEEVANATERGYFDSSGRSIDERLKREKGDGRVKLTPEVKKRIVLKEEVARPLIENGSVELDNRYYVRPLNDYEEAFNKQYVRSHELTEQIALFTRESSQIQQSNGLGQEMISFRQVENQQLTSDLNNYTREVDVLKTAVEQAEQQLAELKTNLSRIYGTIQARSARLTSTPN